MPFKTTEDLYEYHERCVRWDDDKQWPGIVKLMDTDNDTPEAISFRKLFKKLSQNQSDELTITIKRRNPQIRGKSWDEYVPAPGYQEVFDFYARCGIPFKTLSDFWLYHEQCVRWDADKQWPNIGVLMRAKNNSVEAVAFRKLYTKLNKLPGTIREENLTINIQPRDPQIQGKSHYEYFPAPNYQEVFDFYAKCDVPFKTIDDLYRYHDLCVCMDDDKQWPDIGVLLNTNNKSAEAISFKELFNKVSNHPFDTMGGGLTITIKERKPRVPGKSMYEYIPTPPTFSITGKDLLGMLKGENKKPVVKTPTVVQAQYVYFITYPNNIVKVGRHSGAIKGLLGRYNTHTPTYKIEHFKCSDYINTEKAIHNTLKSQGLHEHLEFFKDTPQTRAVWRMFKELNK